MVVFPLSVGERNRHMLAIAKRIGAIIILQHISVFIVLLLEPIGHLRGLAFFLVNYRICFDDKPP